MIRKMMALTLALVMALSLAACGSSGSSTAASTAGSTAASTGGDETPADGSIALTVSMPLGQWTDNFDTLIDSYMAEHPEIASIDATFPSSDKYNDLLKSALSAGELPDIISVSYGILNSDWFQYCVDLSTDCPAYDLLTDAQKDLGTTEQS